MRKPLAAVLLIPSARLLIVQGFGIAATDDQLRPIFNVPSPLQWPLVGAGIFLSIVSPVTSTAALFAAIKGSASLPLPFLLLLICGLFFATSWFGCLWTFSGHQTWTQGYGAR